MKSRIVINKIKRGVMFFVLLFVLSEYSFGQSYLPYIATVYDSVASTGYYFTAPKLVYGSPVGNRDANMILDRYGDVVYYRCFPYPIRATDFKLQKNGLITYSDYGNFYIMDSTFTILDTIKPPAGMKFDGHEFQMLPNGHFMFIALEKYVMDLSAYHFFNHNTLQGSDSAIVTGCIIVEMDSSKNIVFEWHCRDYFAFEDTDYELHYNPNAVDWNHCNALELDVDGNILLSTRNFNEITKINRTDSTIIWRWGGKQNEFTFINDSIHFHTQHDCRRIANGNITLWDNGFQGPFHPAIAKEYLVDEINKTATLVWSYIHDSTLFSDSRGNVQRLANGNTVVDYGRYDGDNIVFSCVKPSGAPVFELKFPDTCVSFRSFNYPVLPWNLNRPVITCEQIGGQVFLSVDSGLSSYQWNTGDTTFKIAITSLDTFNVFVPRGSGGFIKSENFIVSSFSNPCNLSSNPDIPSETFFLQPNPVTDKLLVKTGKVNAHDALIEITDLFGKQVLSIRLSNDNQVVIPVTSFSSGIYFIKMNSIVKKFVKI